MGTISMAFLFTLRMMKWRTKLNDCISDNKAIQLGLHSLILVPFSIHLTYSLNAKSLTLNSLDNTISVTRCIESIDLGINTKVESLGSVEGLRISWWWNGSIMMGWNVFDIVKVDCLSRPSNTSCGTLMLNLEYPVSAKNSVVLSIYWI